MKTVTLVVVLILLILVAACAPAAPTPTPEPRPTPVWVLATKPEHLAGLWYHPFNTAVLTGSWYYQFMPDGTVKWEMDREEPTANSGRFWFEEGVYYQEGDDCFGIGSYRAYLRIEKGRAVALRFEEIDDSDPSCVGRREQKLQTCYWVDR
jgi:hypothetical protein